MIDPIFVIHTDSTVFSVAAALVAATVAVMGLAAAAAQAARKVLQPVPVRTSTRRMPAGRSPR